MADFMECLECAVKPGSPILCPICVHNRTAMEKLQTENAALREALDDIASGRGMFGVDCEFDLKWALLHAEAALARQTAGEG